MVGEPVYATDCKSATEKVSASVGLNLVDKQPFNEAKHCARSFLPLARRLNYVEAQDQALKTVDGNDI